MTRMYLDVLNAATAGVSRTPVRSGDGYGYGGTWIVSIGETALLIGEEEIHEALAHEVALRWNSFFAAVDPRLVYAASDMLAALKVIVNADAESVHVGFDNGVGGGAFVYADAIRTDSDAFSLARAAIAKAEGRQP